MRLSILIFFLFIVKTVTAQQSYFRFDRITTQEGLPSNNTKKIIQDKQGFIWIGTSEGLCRYDGYHFTTFTYNPSKAHSLINNYIYDLSEDENGNIWITTAGGWCELLYNTQTFLNENDFKKYHGVLPDYNPEFITADHHHHIIMGGYSGSCVLNLPDSSFKQFSYTHNNIITPNGLANIYKDDQGFTWINFQNGNRVYDPFKNKLIDTFTNSGTYPIIQNAGVLLKQKDNVWMGLWGKGIYVFNLQYQTFKTLGKDTDGLKEVTTDIQPRKMIVDNYGNIWLLVVDEGIYYMDFKHKNFQLIRNKANDNNSLPSQTVQDIMKDKDGNIWIATDKGIARWNDQRENFQLLSYTNYIPPNFIPASKTNFQIDDVLETNNELWMSLSPSGLIAVNKDNSAACRQIQIDAANQVSAMNRMVNFLIKDDYNNIWISTQEGYAKYDLANNFVQPFYVARHDITVNKFCQTAMMLRNDDSTMWIASKKGLGKLNVLTNAVRWHVLPATHKTGIAFMISKILKQNDSILWLVTIDGGLFSYNINTETFKQYSSQNLKALYKPFDDCYDALFISDSIMMLASQFYGLIRFNINNKTFKIYSTVDGLPSNNIRGLYADNYNGLWITTTNGLSRLNLKTQTFSYYDYSNGLKDPTFPNNISFYPEQDGNVLLLDGSGILRFNPSEFAKKETIPAVTFTSFEKYDVPFFYDKPLEEMNNIHLSYNDRYFTIRFSTLNFQNTSRTKYAYQLKGLDDSWHTTNTPFVSYSNLSGGDYTLHIKASLDGSNWSHEKVLSIIVTPPFWKTWWFYTACCFVIFIMIYSFYRMRINQLKHELYLRNKIARDLHDDVGSTLSSLSMVSALATKKIHDDPSKTKELLEKITESSERMTGNMQDIVWAVNPVNDSFSQILARMQDFAAQTFESKNIELIFTVDEKIKTLKLPLQYRSDLFMIFKEAVNNTAKYSKANHAWISINKINKQIQLEIKDDGIGFDVSKISKGNGLKNMQERAKNLDAQLYISSNNKGTITKLKLYV